MEEIQGYNAWAEKYKPIKNHLEKYPTFDGTYMFETYGDEVEFVKSQDIHNVWTWVTGDMSDLLIPGFGYVNRFGYYICEVPWTDEDEYVLLSVEKECVCYKEEGYEFTLSNGTEITQDGDPNCKICEGYGLVTEYVG